MCVTSQFKEEVWQLLQIRLVFVLVSRVFADGVHRIAAIFRGIRIVLNSLVPGRTRPRCAGTILSFVIGFIARHGSR